MAKLLVVDDERDIRLLYSHDLSEERYQAATAASVSEAEEKLTESSPSTRMGHSRREARLTTQVFFVQFDDSAQWPFCVSMGLHEGVNSMSEFPSGLLGDAQVLCQKDRRYTFTGIDHEVHGHEPGLQRQLGGMQRRPGCNCNLPMTSCTFIQSGSYRRA